MDLRPSETGSLCLHLPDVDGLRDGRGRSHPRVRSQVFDTPLTHHKRYSDERSSTRSASINCDDG